ncbi:hypothetical protein UPYG_G00255730 [Umbra pygmaea]|uniref:Uncharacterized protein n=1 Tax=Umbra pygmaea TaxID=75934 RepID=A0ABD0W8D6_UMBPY
MAGWTKAWWMAVPQLLESWYGSLLNLYQSWLPPMSGGSGVATRGRGITCQTDPGSEPKTSGQEDAVATETGRGRQRGKAETVGMCRPELGA